MFCDMRKQIPLHREFRPSLRSWRELNLIQGEVMTYHGGLIRNPCDSLYLCLDISSVEKPSERRRLFLSKDLIEKIPNDIAEKVKAACIRHAISVSYDEKQPPLDRLEIRDYEVFMQEVKSTEEYGAPMEEILRFASAGTDVALEMLPRWDGYMQIFTDSEKEEMVRYAHAALVKRLGVDYPWMVLALHFVENPLMKPTGSFPGLARQIGLVKN
jgi:hypothetical protein